MNIMSRLRSFRYAFAGVRLLFSEERNARIHATITVLVVVAGIVLRVSPVEWVVLVICIGMVLAAEAFNSAIERVADYLTTERDELAKFKAENEKNTENNCCCGHNCGIDKSLGLALRPIPNTK